jgi:hypothetical protein
MVETMEAGSRMGLLKAALTEMVPPKVLLKEQLKVEWKVLLKEQLKVEWKLMEPEKMMRFLKARWKLTATEDTNKGRDDRGCKELAKGI